jgi:L-arabinokinase
MSIHFLTPPEQSTADLPAALAQLDRQGAFFHHDAPIALRRAPGRLDLMGGIADYSGALVLQLPLACAIFVAAQRDSAPTITVRSVEQHSGFRIQDSEGSTLSDTVFALADLAPGGVPLDEAAAQSFFKRDAASFWAAYVIGPLLVLARTRGLQLTQGLRLLVVSAVPAGKGVSSSAALEVAALQASAAVYNIPIEARELALVCQRAENLVVGAPCGVMDQMAVSYGEMDRLLALRCQPAELEAPVRLPAGLEVWGIDSGIRHAVGGSDYGAVRTGAFMGYRILADMVGLPVTQLAVGRVQVDDRRWRGCLANVEPAEWEMVYRAAVPERMFGAEFLARYGGITDAVTQVDPLRDYTIRAPTAHPIYEQQRVRLFRALLLAGADGEEARHLLGELMRLSHASYSACGLGSAGTDELVTLAAARRDEGIYGAKITGGGSGGTVALLARRGSAAVVQRIAAEYSQLSGHEATVLGGSSPGAAAFGVAWLRVERKT